MRRSEAVEFLKTKHAGQIRIVGEKINLESVSAKIPLPENTKVKSDFDVP